MLEADAGRPAALSSGTGSPSGGPSTRASKNDAPKLLPCSSTCILTQRAFRTGKPVLCLIAPSIDSSFASDQCTWSADVRIW